MNSRTVRCTAGEIGRIKLVEDFLPSPDALVAREDNVKVTLGLSRRSVEYFKRAAKTRRVPYQRMIRSLVDAYAEKQRKAWAVENLGGREQRPASSPYNCSKMLRIQGL